MAVQLKVKQRVGTTMALVMQSGDFRFGSLADIVQRPRHVCFPPKADIRQCEWDVRKCHKQLVLRQMRLLTVSSRSRPDIRRRNHPPRAEAVRPNDSGSG